VIDVSVTISPIRNPQGAVIGASTVARDISERKRAAAALVEAEERFRGAFEEAPIGMVMLTERLRVCLANATMYGCWAATPTSSWGERSSSSRILRMSSAAWSGTTPGPAGV
jgi:PAS domain-containing protein